jgi:hypothetical protein
MFLPDYPWPSPNVLINGRGQTSCEWTLWEDCEKVRQTGWTRNEELVKKDEKGHVHSTIGQCMTERPPLMGYCNPDAAPARLYCAKSGTVANPASTRFRVINMGFSVPLR